MSSESIWRKAKDYDNGTYGAIESDDGPIVDIGCGCCDAVAMKESDANLIIAAPEAMRLLKDMSQIKAAADGQTPVLANQGQALDGYSELHNYRAIAEKAQLVVKAQTTIPA